MKNFLKCLFLGLIAIIAIAIYQGAKSDGKIIGVRIKEQGKTQ